INHLAVRRDGHAVAATFIRFFPEDIFAAQIKAGERFRRADVKAFRGRVGANPLDVEWLAFFVQPRRLQALQETVAVIDVEHEHAVSAVFQVIANAGFGDEKQVALASAWTVGGTEAGADLDDESQEQAPPDQRHSRSSKS